jgi:SPP1 gp7 family putative phage head morphogenesis protein
VAAKLAKQAWPGWYTDSQLAAEYAQSLSRQLAASVNAGRLAATWLALHGTDDTTPASAPGEVAKARRKRRKRRRRRSGGGDGGQQPPAAPPPEQPSTARRFLATQGVTSAIAVILLNLLTALWGAAWGLGWASALAVLGVGEIRGAERGLAALLREARGRIDGITQTRVARLERVLIAALRDGTTVDELAQQISAILGSLTSALLVTQTETTWASGWAAYWVYKLAGIKWVRWLSRRDGLVCPHCRANDAEGPIRLGQRFLSGLKRPPQHPRCRCVLMPATAPKAKKAAA